MNIKELNESYLRLTDRIDSKKFNHREKIMWVVEDANRNYPDIRVLVEGVVSKVNSAEQAHRILDSWE